MRFVLLLMVIGILSSCDKEEVSDDRKSNLIGSWDAYYGIFPDGPVDGLQYAVLHSYEHGFELSGDGIYKSRYAKVAL